MGRGCGTLAGMLAVSAKPSPDFRLYQSNALEVLAGLLAEEVARAPGEGGLLRPDIVVVPQHAMRRWLQWQLAERLGICANLRFLAPGQFVDIALDANLGKAPEADRLAPDVLRWHLLREFDDAPPAALAGYLADPDPRRGWVLAGALADTFEKYQAWRRDWLLRWERTAPRDDWQAQLWRRVARGREYRARRIDAYLSRHGPEGAAPTGLPSRLFVFACQNVSPDVLQVMASQSRAGTQHWYMHTPVRPYWGGLQRFAAEYAPSRDDDFLGEDRPNPLLAAWGQAGRDFVASLGGGQDVPTSLHLESFAEPPRHTLLGRMQADLLDNRAPLDRRDADPGEPAWPRATVDRTDASLQFHACHTRLREVQVLHDQLRALLEAPPPDGEAPLQPRDITVLAPDIDPYAPHVEAVFGGALGSSRELPYTIADTSPLASAPLARAFLRLCALPLQPLGVPELLDLLAVPALAARFGIEAREHAQLAEWLEAAGARWGLDAEDRARVTGDAPARDASYTVAFAIERLLLGYASGSDDDIAGIAPWPGLEGQAADTLDALLRCVDLLEATRAALARPQSPAGWRQALETLLDDAFVVERDSADAAVRQRIREVVLEFSAGAEAAGYTGRVAHAVVHEHLRNALADADPRAPFLSGGICFGRMVPMRNIPFRVICVLGLDEAAFPARDPRDPLNRLSLALGTGERRAGDPSRREADRYLFLQLFASADRTLYLSWCGMDPRDNSRREPSAVVSELLDAAARYHGGDAEAVREGLVVRHALQPFSPAAYGAPHEAERVSPDLDHEPRRFSYDARWHPAASGSVGTGVPPPFAPPVLRLPARPEEEPGSVDLARLRRMFLRPHAVYLQEGLGMRLPEDEAPLPEHEPLGAPDALGNYALQHAVFEGWLRAGKRPEPAPLHARLLARGLVAPGPDGVATVRALLGEIEPFARRALDAGFGGVGKTAPFSISCGRRELRGTLDGAHGPGLLRVVLNANGVHGKHRVRHGLDWLCAATLGLPLHELAVPRKGDAPVLVPWPSIGANDAVAILRSLLDLREAGLRSPLVFLPKSGFDYVSRLADGKREEVAWQAAAARWNGSDWQPGQAEASAATRVALRGRDPFVDDDADARARFSAVSKALFDALGGGTPVDLAAPGLGAPA